MSRMIRQEPEHDDDIDQFEVEAYEKQQQRPSNWNHQPKRAGKKSRTDKESERQKSKTQHNGEQDKRKFKIEDKIFRKVAHQTDQQGGKAQQVVSAATSSGFKVDKEVEHICNILKYMLGEHALQGKTEYVNEQRTCETWELDEIMKQVSDTNLGDFIFKCPNPDNLPDDWKEKYQVKEEDNSMDSENKEIRASQAMEFFYDLFDVETYSKLESERENVAFLVAFYFLKYKSNFDSDPDEVADSMLKVYDFYKMVQGKTLKEYVQMRQSQNFFQKHQYIIAQLFVEQFEYITCLKDKSKWPNKTVDDFEQMWRNLNRTIYIHLNEQLISIIGSQKQDEKPEGRYLFGRVRSISELLRTFPDLIEKVLLKVKYYDEHKDQLQEREEKIKEEQKARDEGEKSKKSSNKQIQQDKKPSQMVIQEQKLNTFDNGKRLLFWGQYLKKTIVGQNVIWVNTKSRPNDVATLLRMSLLYKLVIKSKLFVRQFLSRDEKHIMLVTKTSEQILQNYAMKYKITMEVDLGASDLFSFEPVDQYLRPLRLHKYVTDQQFMDKYNIKPTKAEANKKEETQSIESEALNIYKKVQQMNQDELRTLVITQQLEANDLLKFLTKKLNIDYIQQHPLENEYNRDNTDRELWEIYYIYNKIIISFIKRIKGLYTVSRKETAYYTELDGNLGMLLRLMFLKALDMCNEMYYEHREVRSMVPRLVSNFCNSDNENKLRTIWYYIGIDSPSGYFTYERIQKAERLWRKYEVNELKERSKFFPSERLIITNRVITEIINLSSSLDKKHIIDYYPLHDPFTLKSIEVAPYLSVIKNLKKKPVHPTGSLDSTSISRLYSQYQCKSTVSDFTKMSVEKQLQFKCTEFKTFETRIIRAYCGQKIAFYFTLIKFLALKAWPLVLPAFIIQCLLWTQNSDIAATGSSSLTGLNNFLISMWCLVNLFWTTDIIETWKQQERTLAQQYGVTKIQQNQERRVKFQGAFKRDFETDELNFEYVPKWQTTLKAIFTVTLNLAYVALVTEIILMIFLFKTYLYQKGEPQFIVQQVPSIMIALASQIFTKLYTILIKNITNFENHKTVTLYEASLVSKTALITFVINFFSIFIYAYFSGYIGASFLCQIRTTQTNVKIDNCDFYVSAQLQSIILADFITTIIGAFTPLLIFKIGEWMESRSTTKTSKFSFSFFEAIDNFYEEQDKMDSYMYTEELDCSWLGYMNIVNVFAVTALFAPAYPLAYTMMFLTGIVRLHASKYDTIYYKKRILPTKTNSINWWLNIIEVISFMSIITNVAYMIYTRVVFPNHQAKLFFFFIIVAFAIKSFMLAQYSSGTDIMAKRNEIKITDILKNRRRDQFDNIPEELNTDIENVIYDQTKLNRKFHEVKGPNIKNKEQDIRKQ